MTSPLTSTDTAATAATTAVAPLRRLNPLAKILATAPAIALLFLTKDPYAPGAAIVLTLLLLGSLGGLVWRRLGLMVAAVAVLGAVGTVALGLLVPAEGSPILVELGPIGLSGQGVFVGSATTLRLISVILLVLLGSLTTRGDDLVLALQQQARLPYRYAYAARTGLVLGPLLLTDLRTVAMAHRVRGTVDGHGPIAWCRRRIAYLVPVLAGGIRQAERMALAMDSRAFGVGTRRTERRTLTWRPHDTAAVLSGWAAIATLLITVDQLGLLAPLSMIPA